MVTDKAWTGEGLVVSSKAAMAVAEVTWFGIDG